MTAFTPVRDSGMAPERHVPAIPGPLTTEGRRPTGMVSDFTLWQVADSAFPTGGFAHSGGLEAAHQHGEVRNREELRAWLAASLDQWTYSVLPLVGAGHREPGRLEDWDRMNEAFTSNHVANRASRLQGRAWLAVVTRVFNLSLGEPPFIHFAPVFGASLRLLGRTLADTGRLFLFLNLRGVVAAAVRLNLVGPLEAQRMQYEFADRAEAAALCGVCLGLDELAQTSPLLDLWQGAQDRLYSRLFQT